MMVWLLSAMIFLPLVGAAAVLMLARDDDGTRRMALGASVGTLALTIIVVATSLGGGVSRRVNWIHTDASSPGGAAVRIDYHVDLDGISVWLVVLTAVLTPLAIAASFTGIRGQIKEYYALMLVLQTGMLGVFCARDLLLFYVFFEFTLVPLFFIIGIWGGPERRRAAGMFFIYTMAGSMLMFAGVLYLAWRASQQPEIGAFTFAFDDLYKLAGNVSDPLTVREQWWLFLALFAGFAIKVPLFPVHTWLPLAHTEAPTAGSVILAGVLLKLGTYGLLRINLPMLPDATIMLAPFMATLAIVGIVYGALIAWVQEDIKKLVAYSSVSHLGFCVLGMFSLTEAGLRGSLLYMINHGLSTAALFLVVGCIYERYHTRSIHRIGGLARRMPVMAFFLIFFTLASIGLPGLNGFVSEFLVLLGTFTSAEQAGPLGWSYAAFAALGIILSAVYMLWMCQRVLFGPLVEPEGTPDKASGLSVDLTPREVGILTPLAVLCLVLGLFPNLVLSTMGPALDREILARVMATGGAPAALGADATSFFNAPEGRGRVAWGASPRSIAPQKPQPRRGEGSSTPRHPSPLRGSTNQRRPLTQGLRPGLHDVASPRLIACPLETVRRRSASIMSESDEQSPLVETAWAAALNSPVPRQTSFDGWVAHGFSRGEREFGSPNSCSPPLKRWATHQTTIDKAPVHGTVDGSE